MNPDATLAKRWFTEVWVRGGETTVRELMAEHVIGYMEGGVDIPRPVRRTQLHNMPSRGTVVL